MHVQNKAKQNNLEWIPKCTMMAVMGDIIFCSIVFKKIKNRKIANLPLIIYILWPQWSGIGKKCHSTWSHLGINSGMGGNETLDQFMGGLSLVLSRWQRKGKWGMHKDSQETHTGFNYFLKITLNITPKNPSYCLKKKILSTKPKIDLSSFNFFKVHAVFNLVT